MATMVTATSPAMMMTASGTVTPAITGVVSAGADTILACGVVPELVARLAPRLVTRLVVPWLPAGLMVGLVDNECIGIAGELAALLETTLNVFTVAARVTVEMGGVVTFMNEDAMLFAKLKEDVLSVELVTMATVDVDETGTTELSTKVPVLVSVRPVDEAITKLLASLELEKKGPVELVKG